MKLMRVLHRLRRMRVIKAVLISVITTCLIVYIVKLNKPNAVNQIAESNKRRIWEADGTVMATNASDITSKHEERWRTEAPQWAPFLPGLPRSVVVLAYQRSDSSNIGALFNNDHRAFYLLEPLDGVYSSIYGTSPGWNIPSDITSYANGTERVIPTWEAEAVEDTLKDIFTCNVDRLPTHLLTHSFWHLFYNKQKSARPFADCLQRSGAKLSSCINILRDHCPGRFGANWTQMNDCIKGLSSISNDVQVEGYRSRRLKYVKMTPAASGNIAHTNNAKPKRTKANVKHHLPPERKRILTIAPKHKTRGSSVLSVHKARSALPRVSQQQRDREVFQRYSHCLSQQAELVKPCMWHLYMACQSSELRVVKTVRATMSEMDQLFQTLPNFRLVHVIRDPRGVITSRRSFLSYRGIGSGSDAVSEARIYCRDVLRDIKMRKSIEARYPGRSIQIIYDDLIKSSTVTIQTIYTFLNLTAPPHATLFSKSTKTTSAEDWTKTLTWGNVKDVDIACKELYRVVGSNWQH